MVGFSERLDAVMKEAKVALSLARRGAPGKAHLPPANSNGVKHPTSALLIGVAVDGQFKEQVQEIQDARIHRYENHIARRMQKTS